jgi:hypothetical protein
MPAKNDAAPPEATLAAWLRIRADAVAARRIRRVPQRPRDQAGSKRA